MRCIARAQVKKPEIKFSNFLDTKFFKLSRSWFDFRFKSAVACLIPSCSVRSTSVCQVFCRNFLTPPLGPVAAAPPGAPTPPTGYWGSAPDPGLGPEPTWADAAALSVLAPAPHRIRGLIIHNECLDKIISRHLRIEISKK